LDFKRCSLMCKRLISCVLDCFSRLQTSSSVSRIVSEIELTSGVDRLILIVGTFGDFCDLKLVVWAS